MVFDGIDLVSIFLSPFLCLNFTMETLRGDAAVLNFSPVFFWFRAEKRSNESMRDWQLKLSFEANLWLIVSGNQTHQEL